MSSSTITDIGDRFARQTRKKLHFKIFIGIDMKYFGHQCLVNQVLKVEDSEE